MSKASVRILIAAALLVALPLGWWWFRCGPATTFLIVRHADRPTTGEDALTSAGVARAQELARVAAKAGVVAVYSTDTVRTRETAAPAAAALGLTTTLYAPADSSGLVAGVLADHGGATVLVVGHSNTVPLLVEAAGGPLLPEIDEKEFDNLFVVTPCTCRRGPARVVNLQYGPASP